MQTSGLVITTHKNEQIAEVQNRLQQFQNMEMGESDQNRLAVVIETADQSESKTITSKIEAYPEVSYVDVVFVHFGEEQQDSKTHISIQ